MAAGYKQIYAEHDGFSPVGDTSTAVTYDLEKGEIVLIIADAPAATGFIPHLTLMGAG